MLVPSVEGGLERGGVSPRAEAPRGLGRGGLERGGVGLLSEGRSSTLERGGDRALCWRPRQGGLERGGGCFAGSRGASDGPYRRAGLWAVYRSGFFGTRRGSGCRGELEELHDIRVRSDDGVVTIGGFVNLQPVRRLLPLQDRRRVVLLPLQIGGRRLALARHDV